MYDFQVGTYEGKCFISRRPHPDPTCGKQTQYLHPDGEWRENVGLEKNPPGYYETMEHARAAWHTWQHASGESLAFPLQRKEAA